MSRTLSNLRLASLTYPICVQKLSALGSLDLQHLQQANKERIGASTEKVLNLKVPVSYVNVPL
jgi:hypothetical protein